MEVEPIQDDLSRTDNHATSAAETDQDFMSWTRKEIEGKQDLFIVDERYKTATLSIAGDIFRGKKGTWKGKHFTRHDTTAKRLADEPSALTEGEWKDLVTFWETDATHQKYSEQNVKSRSCQQVKHTMGRKNHARCKAEMAEDNGGNPPTDGDVFIKTM
ncbi:hypothetical protein C5167_001428 [Papaver somniferum]|uniref:Uncharacterized protein n=1 Tax=Papaver somniferum TaxID=3469 RepID=A0A4Y7KY18_PAPSO|nr:hypothetical protein C5167_001428 [Papaver somniferum]